MQFNKIYIKNRVFYLPGNINTLTEKQYRLLVRFAHQNNNPEAQFLLFFALLVHPKNRKNLWWFRLFFIKNEYFLPFFDKYFPKSVQKIEKLDIESLHDAIDHCTKFLFSDQNPLVINHLKKIYPKHRFAFQKLFFKAAIARQDTLYDFSLIEFSNTEEAYIDYTNKNESGLTRIIQILYNDDAITDTTHDELTRTCILHYYENVRGYIFSCFPLTFPKSSTGSSTGSIDIAEAYKFTIHLLANEDLTKYDAVANAALWDCLYAHEQKLKSIPKQ